MRKTNLFLLLALVLSLILSVAALAQEVTGTAKGFGGDVSVTLTIEGGVIAQASAVGDQETDGIGKVAIEKMPLAMVNTNSIDVDGVAGATLTTNAVREAAASALEQAGLKAEDLVKVEAPAEEAAGPAFENPDVIIVGAGSTGINAAIAAAEQGAKVYLIEKNDALGGSIRFAGGTTSAAGAQMQIDAGVTDSPENFAEDIVRMGGGTNVPELTRKHTENAAAAVDWLDSLGADFGDREPKMSASYDAFNVAREYRVTGNGKAIIEKIIPVLEAQVEKGNVSVLLNTQVKDIIVEDAAVKGVVLEDGTEYRAPATILTTGGYGHNEELLHKYNYENVLTMAPSFVTGDGYAFAEKAGAQFSNMDYLPAYPGAVPVGGFDVTATAVVMEYPGVIWVNANGERVVNEFGALDSERKAAYAGAPHNLIYMILTEEMRAGEASIISKDEGWAKFDELLAAENCVVKADTVEALADKIGVPADALKQTVETYNGYAQAGEDQAFGRPAESMVELKGPFYALKTCPYVMLTKGGPLMNENAQVLSQAGEPIPGLYEGGELAGGANIGGSANIGGLANTSTIVWGKIAGESAANYALGAK